MSKQFTLGKKERLKSRKLIEQLFSEGQRFAISPFRVHYVTGKIPGFLLQAGVGVSSRHFKKAVDRNRIKRLVREAWRLQKLTAEQALREQNRSLHVFLIYTAKELPVYTEVYEKMGRVMNKLSIIIATPT